MGVGNQRKGQSDMRKPITEKQRTYIIAHINDRPRTRVAHDAGCSINTLYRIIREHGGELRYELTRRGKDTLKNVAEMYPVMSASEIARATGLSKSTVQRAARQLGVRHNQATMERLDRERRQRAVENVANVDHKAIGRKRRAMYRLEYFRLWEGKPQQTSLKLATISSRQYNTLWYLCKKRGYFHHEDDAELTLRYDGRTRRTRNEQRLAQKHGITFLREGLSSSLKTTTKK